MGKISVEQIFNETGFTFKEIEQGYIVCRLYEYDIEVIQKLDCLESYGLRKFTSDTEAGGQALKDGYNLFTSNHQDLIGWYIVDTPKNRKLVKKIEGIL